MYWDFGDGTNLFQAAPGISFPLTHSYAAPGVYTICLTMWVTQLGSSAVITCTGCQNITIGITPPPPCNAQFTFTQSGLTAAFTSTSTGPGPITSHVWSYGDGTPNGTTANVTHTYAAAGTYVVCHTIAGGTSTGTTAFTCTTCDTLIVGTPPPPPCNASFTFTQAGTTVSFTSTSSGPGPITSHVWTYGDGTPNGTTANPTHTYAASGAYVVCHTISGVSSTGTTSFTCTTCDTITISITPPPCNASFAFTQSGNTVSFTSTSSGPGPITSHVWMYGDGTPNGNTANPVHTYATAGTYVVCHIVSGTSTVGTGFTCTTCDTLIIAPTGASCVATAGYSSTIAGSTVTFANSSTCVGCTSTTYLWKFGDGSPNSVLMNPVHVYTAPGTYTACLLVTGIDGAGNLCKDSICKPHIIGSTAVTDINQNAIAISPNPGTSEIQITLPESIGTNISLYDIAGRHLLTKPIQAGVQNYTLQVAHLDAGVYFIRVADANRQYTRKWIKQ